MSIVLCVKLSSVVYSILENTVDEHPQTNPPNAAEPPIGLADLPNPLLEGDPVGRTFLGQLIDGRLHPQTCPVLQAFTPRDSTNQRFKTTQRGLKWLAKVEQAIQDQLRSREARRYNKSYSGELVHFYLCPMRTPPQVSSGEDGS